MSVILKLDTLASSTPPEDAIADALKVAERIGVWVEVSINGVVLMIHPEDRLSALQANWRKALERGAKFASANVVPNGPA